MNADGMVSGERCNCEGQLRAEAALVRLRSEIDEVVAVMHNHARGITRTTDALILDWADRLAALARGGE